MNIKPKILVIDDEPSILTVMKANLKREGYEVHLAENGMIGFEKIKSYEYDTIIADYQMPKMTGMQVLEEMQMMQIDVPVIIVTAHGSIEQAVDAMQKGALNYLTKPINYDELVTVVRNTVKQQALKKEVKRLRREVDSRYNFSSIIGQNEKMRAIFDLITDVADTDATVLIHGETGTGKELIAKAIHYNSYRKNESFVRVNCAALAETLLESELFGHEKGAFTGALTMRIGRFEQADKGTIFLDEVGDISSSTQSKLLRVLQEREFERVGSNETLAVNVRVIAATNRKLEQDVARKEFRQDLYYRLNVIPIELPPLRDRVDDIPLLAVHFLNRYAKKFHKNIEEIDARAVQLLMVQSWPGNIRQLENVIERAVIKEKGNCLTRETISGCIRLPQAHSYQYFINEELSFNDLKSELVAKFEREYISRILKRYDGNISRAARHAGIHYKNFCEKMKKYEMTKWDFVNTK
ncbi:MAG TPA: sigma-54-dependent Fis family transcriptional regulator [Caldithrix abyssi]|uniref:Sigma-54-dependent Fis family transcriptional regulator n=1 Tax=Caldithrix abyssi TaxID=187145 RepID=A0A7V1LPY0_CALAY|nr:sigma-54-dependent Fis family transcriptional regulator [Caldithrix abyssi]